MHQPQDQYPIIQDLSNTEVTNESVHIESTQVAEELGLQAVHEMLPEIIKSPDSAEAIANQGYVEVADGMQLKAPRLLMGAVKHVSNRQDSIGAYRPKEGDSISEISESDAIGETIGFLENYQKIVTNNAGASEKASSLANYADKIAKNTVYMSEVDISKAAEGLASYWEKYLVENPLHRIIAVSSERKSSGYMSKKIVDALPEALRGRIDNLDMLYEPDSVAKSVGAKQYIENTKVILVDDWMISGRQMQTTALQEVLPALNGYISQHAGADDKTALMEAFEKQVEVDLAIDSAHRIENGLRLSDGVTDTQVPVKAYWASPASSTIPSYEHGQPLELLVTGSHSSTDDGFEIPCMAIVQVLKEEYGIDTTLPPLANIVREYRKAV